MQSCIGKSLLWNPQLRSMILQLPVPVILTQERSLTNRKSIYQLKKSHKHYLPKWRKLRGLKVIKLDLPDFQEKDEDMYKLTPDEIRSKMKEKGIQPIRPWQEKQIELSCTSEVAEPYIPPEGDGKASIISTDFAKQNVVRIEKKSKSMLAARKIRSYDEDFDTKQFASEIATDIYIKMHEAMMTKDEYKIGEYATEHALSQILHNLELKTMRWKFLESIEPASVVHIRCINLIAKDNMFAQITCRLHTKQTLAIYDRFGRLMFGNELTPKDVLEYVVFEKHLANIYGSWRVHGKIIPEWKGTGMDIDMKRTVARHRTGEEAQNAAS